ncbi:MAG TPA: glycosyltransferase [Longimicrobiales bacterium]|nr:glycosyltransferase [Longimicrobiales bacterium]
MSATAPARAAPGDRDLSVIVVTWNVAAMAEVCVRRVLERCGRLDIEVLVVDNASPDGTADTLRTAFRAEPRVAVLDAGANVGFPRANNIALGRARGRHVLFLNPDTEVGEGTLEACVAELDADASVGAVGCRLEYADGTVQSEGGRRHYRLLDLLWEGLYLQVLFPGSRVFAGQLMGEWDHTGRRDVEALMGAFIMARREAALEVGGLPDELFMYHEDMAFCLRLGRRGRRVRYLGDVATLHHAGASARASSSPLGLLEGEVRVRLIRERSGWAAGVAARALFGVRSLCRVLAALVVRPVPALRRRYPRVAEVSRHALLLAWTVWPGVVARRLARSGIPVDERPWILVVAPTPPPVHGTSVYSAMLFSSMELRARFRVRHVDTADRRSLDNLGRFDVQNVLLGLRHLAETALAVAAVRPRVVYVPIAQNGPAYLRDALFIGAARLGGARVVTHLHGGHFGAFYREAGPLLRLTVRISQRWVHRCWVLGEGLRGLFDGLLPPERVRVVPNGTPAVAGLDRKPGEDRGAGVARREGDSCAVLFLGQLCAAKGLDDLLAVLERQAAGGAALHGILAGEFATEAERRALEPRIRALEKAGRARFVGLVQGTAKAEALADADVFALPSKFAYEGQPLAILEAMAAGLPVVSTPRAAIPDMVRDGETGLLVAEGSVDELAAALDRLARDPSLRRRMGEAGRALHAECFTRERSLARAVEELADAAR